MLCRLALVEWRIAEAHGHARTACDPREQLGVRAQLGDVLAVATDDGQPLDDQVNRSEGEQDGQRVVNAGIRVDDDAAAVGHMYAGWGGGTCAAAD